MTKVRTCEKLVFRKFLWLQLIFGANSLNPLFHRMGSCHFLKALNSSTSSMLKAVDLHYINNNNSNNNKPFHT